MHTMIPMIPVLVGFKYGSPQNIERVILVRFYVCLFGDYDMFVFFFLFGIHDDTK